MNLKFKKIIAALMGCCMVLGGCGKVDVAEDSESVPQIISRNR